MSLIRSILSDTFHHMDQIYAYLYWNAKGIRITPDCYISRKAQIEQGVSFTAGTRVFGSSNIGSRTYGSSCIIHRADIGRLCSIAPGTIIGLDEHPVDHVSTSPSMFDVKAFQETFHRTFVGHDVWIGAKAFIRLGVEIGDGCIIAAGAVVVRDCEPFTLYGGVPAKPLKKRDVDTGFVSEIAAVSNVNELDEIITKYRSRFPYPPKLA